MRWNGLSRRRQDARGEREERAARLRRAQFQTTVREADKKDRKAAAKNLADDKMETELRLELERLDMKRLYQGKSGDYSY